MVMKVMSQYQEMKQLMGLQCCQKTAQNRLLGWKKPGNGGLVLVKNASLVFWSWIWTLCSEIAVREYFRTEKRKIDVSRALAPNDGFEDDDSDFESKLSKIEFDHRTPKCGPVVPNIYIEGNTNCTINITLGKWNKVYVSEPWFF